MNVYSLLQVTAIRILTGLLVQLTEIFLVRAIYDWVLFWVYIRDCFGFYLNKALWLVIETPAKFFNQSNTKVNFSRFPAVQEVRMVFFLSPRFLFWSAVVITSVFAFQTQSEIALKYRTLHDLLLKYCSASLLEETHFRLDLKYFNLMTKPFMHRCDYRDLVFVWDSRIKKLNSFVQCS